LAVPVFAPASSSSDSEDEIVGISPPKVLEEWEGRQLEAIKMETRDTAARFPDRIDMARARVR
jgi:hypothetical protein